jgi:hypothetical protein
MGHKSRILLLALLIAVIGVIAWEMRRPAEPIYNGKPLRYWLEAFGQAIGSSGGGTRGGPAPPTQSEAYQAIHHIGSNGIPTLLRMLQTPNPSISDRLVALAQKQHIVRIPFTPANLNEKAFFGFTSLETEASNAVPQLIEIFEKNHASFPQSAAPAILGEIGPASEPAIPVLLQGIGNTNRSVRCNVIFALGKIHAQPNLAVPALMKCLDDPDLYVQASAVHALGAFGKDARVAVPALLELRRKIPSLPGSGEAQPICSVSSLSVEMFSGPFRVTPGGPMNPDLSATTTESLKQIDPEAAAGNLFEKWYDPTLRDDKHAVETLH